MTDQPQGPNPETLRHLKEMLPSFVKGLAKKQAVGRGKPTIRGSVKPRKLCNVCCKLYDRISTTDDIALEKKTCEDCQKLLTDGYVALVSGDEYAFVKDKTIADLAGQVLHLQPQNFAQIREKFQQRKPDV